MDPYATFIQKSARSLADRFRSAVSNSLGLTLMETIIALAIFSSVGTAVLLGVSAAHISSDRVKASAIAENLARNQMEYVFTLQYVAPGNNSSYPSFAVDEYLDLTLPTGYTVSAIPEAYISDTFPTGSIEKVVVTVTRDENIILVLESLRTGP